MKTWEQFLLEQISEYSSTQVNLPLPIANKIKKWAKNFIKEDDLYDKDQPHYGRENEFHITILYGLHANNSKHIQKLLEKETPIKLELKETSIFESKEYDVVKFTVKSEDLKRFNKKIVKNCDHTTNFPQYSPHCTIAYVKKGTGKKYIGNKEFDKVKIIVNNMLFSDKNRIKTKINLVN